MKLSLIAPITAAAAGATLSLGMAVTAPAQAASQSCWIVPASGRSVPGFPCDVSSRYNANGHLVYDIQHWQGNGARFSVIVWAEGGEAKGAELFIDGERYTTSWYRDADGDFRLDMGSYGTFVF